MAPWWPGRCAVPTPRCGREGRFRLLLRKRPGRPERAGTVPNQALREALSNARMSEQVLARRIGVDEKTVARWVHNSRTPHPRHRWAACEVLEADEAVLWPDA